MQLTPQDVISINEKLMLSERHYSKLQANNRIFAGVWLLTTFAALAYAMLICMTIPASGILMLALVAYAGAFGLIMFWNLDMGVYYRLAQSHFREGLNIEASFPELPQVRHNMLALHGGRGVQGRVHWFYHAPVFILLLVATWNTEHYFMLDGWKWWLLWLGSLFFYAGLSAFIRHEGRPPMKFKKTAD